MSRLLISMFVWIFIGTSYCKLNSLLVMGNFSMAGLAGNIVVLEPDYSSISESVLFLYGAYTGVILDAVRNETNPHEVVLVGSFDSPNPLSQSQYCSVAKWTFDDISEVGTGLCPRMGGPQFDVSVVELGSNGDIFVGGPFESRVWDGGEFVNVIGIARFDAHSGLWLPLHEGKFISNSVGALIINGLEWDKDLEMLIIGGQFDGIKSHAYISGGGLAIWSPSDGLQLFPGGPVSMTTNHTQPYISHMKWIEKSKLLIVSGDFDEVDDDIKCSYLAMYAWSQRSWVCLNEDDQMHMFTEISSLSVSEDGLLFISGRNFHSDIYRVSVANLSSLINASAAIEEYHRTGTIADISTNCSSLSCLENQFDSSLLQLPMSINWHWLDNFPGLNGPIMDIKHGTGLLEKYLLISGQFVGYSSIQCWSLVSNSFDYDVVKPPVYGLVSRTLQVDIPVTPTPASSAGSGINKDDDDGLVPISRHKNHNAVDRLLIVGILAACLAGGVMLGISFTSVYRFFKRMDYRKIDSSDGHSLNDDGKENGFGKRPPKLKLSQISMMDDQISLNLNKIFNRALKSRYLASDVSVQLSRIESDEISLVSVIGEGSFGRVWHGFWRNSPVAIKEFLFAQAAIINGSLHSEKIVEEIIGEAALLSSLRHPKVLQIYGVTLTAQALWIISDLCSKGSLRSLLDDANVGLKDIDKLSMAIDVAEAMTYLHTRDPVIIHRDLKSHNIFIHESANGAFTCKVGDWGSARALDFMGSDGRRKSMTQGVGTACWLAPEVIKSALFSRKSDVYGFGIVLWELSTRRDVYADLSAAQIIIKVASEGLRPPIDENNLCTWIHVAQSCWQENPEDRPEFSVVLTELLMHYRQAKPKHVVIN